MADAIIKEVRQELKDNADAKTIETGRRFFKEEVRSYGVKTDIVRKISKRYFDQMKDRPKAEIFGLCEALWQSGYIEESFVACHWSYLVRKEYEPEDFRVFEHWVGNYVSNWASCDTLCNHTIGTLLERYPQHLSELKQWAKSDNRWFRRAAAVSLIIPARKGMFLKEMLELATILLTDKDDLVQKGYGWMLKAASEAHQQEIFDFVMSKNATMPRTALRYAIEKMPKELKSKAMEK